MKKILVSVLVIAVFCRFVASEVTCNSLLNCKTCEDENHCKDCRSGYTLTDSKVCVFDCAKKFGSGCERCTESKCLCPFNQEWNSTANSCVPIEICGETDSEACTLCGKGYDLIDVNGKCSTCEDAFGEGCSVCTGSRCTNVTTNYTLYGAVSALTSCGYECPTTCEALFPGCKTCSADLTKCEECSAGTVLEKGACKFNLPCRTPNKTVLVKGKFECLPCPNAYGSDCIATKCNATSCLQCKAGFFVNNKGGCSNCSKTFAGCGLCYASYCSKCRSSSWILTPNGCFNQNPYVPPEESNGGLIAGIVIAGIALLAIIVVAVICICSSSNKKGQVDPALYEDDFEFKSQSVL